MVLAMNCSTNAAFFVYIWCLLSLIIGFGFCTGYSGEILCIASEREALLKFKHHLRDPADRLISWTPHSDCCKWAGVVCSNVTGHILELHLRSSPPPLNWDWVYDYELYWENDDAKYEAYERSRLGGDINRSLLDLKHLSYLDLSGNNFNGTRIPTFIGSLTSLTYLNLSGAEFTGNIPHRIGNLSNLLYLDLHSSYYSTQIFNGEVPRQIGNLTNLIHLDLGCSDCYSKLLVEHLQWLSSLSNLQYLDMTLVNLSKACDWLEVIHKFPYLKELHLSLYPLPCYNKLSNVNISSLIVLDLSSPVSSFSIPEWIFRFYNLVSLVLSDNDFEGPIPINIQNFTLLENLDLSYNSFNSSIPNWLYSSPRLKHLILQCNILHGTISGAIGNLTSLVTLDMSWNFLEGNLSTSLGNLTSLVTLDMSSNQLEGNLPTSLGNLTSLVTLDMSLNQLEGNLPTSLGNLASLVTLDMSLNQLEGNLPTSLGNLTSLITLDMSWNQLEGNLPASLGNLTSLVELDMSLNQLEGNLPASLGNLTYLVALDMSQNQLEGNLPTSLGNLTCLVTLDMSDNQFEGSLPTSLGNLCYLRMLAFSSNKCDQQIHEIFEIFSSCVAQTLEILSISESELSGHLTDQIGSFKNLSQLSLQNNNIQGPLPRSLGKLPSLKLLELEGNQFKGNPFEIVGQLSQLKYLSIDDNQFQGVVNEVHLIGLESLERLYASNNQLTLEVSPKWSPCFKLIELDMSSWNLGPNFPNWIQSQKNLSYLSISNTGISDSIPTWLWSSFSSADFINLSHNHIYGELPYTLMNLISGVVDLSSNNLSGQLPYLSPHVYHLDLSRNWFSGSITRFLCSRHIDQKSLEFLNLASNNLSGEIPDCWMTWPNMATVKLENNFFIGQIPKSMGSLPLLRYLQLHNNTLSGKFPQFLKNSSELICLDLGENEISGSIPSWIGERLWNLKILRLRSNKFSGPIPHQICTLKFLQVLDLAQNSLSGHIPKCMNQMNAMMIKNNNSFSFIDCYGRNDTAGCIVSMFVLMRGREDEYSRTLALMTSIDLSNNKLSGEIPIEITSLSQLVSLNLSANHLRGPIPKTIGNMGSLESLDFSRNQLSGGIPESITNLSFLEKLDLSCNNLTGKIPAGTQLQTFDASGFVGNDLCGPPLPINCSSPETFHNADDKDKKGNGHEINWFFVSMGFGFVVGFWGFVLPLFLIRWWRYAYYGWLDSMWCKIRYCYW